MVPRERCQHCQLLPRRGWRGSSGFDSVLCCPTNGREALGTFCFIGDCHENLGMGHVREASAKEVILGTADCVGSSSFGQGGNCADSAAPAKELLSLAEFC